MLIYASSIVLLLSSAAEYACRDSDIRRILHTATDQCEQRWLAVHTGWVSARAARSCAACRSLAATLPSIIAVPTKIANSMGSEQVLKIV